MDKLHPFVAPAANAAIDTVAPQAAPNTAQLLAMVQQMQEQIAQLKNALNGKASASGMSLLSQRIGAAEVTLGGKADTIYVDQQTHAIGDVDAGQASAIAAIQQALGTDESGLQAILAQQSSFAQLLAQLRTDVDTKAQASNLATAQGQLTAVRNTVYAAGTGLAATYTLAAGALPLGGGTLTGPLNVLAPLTADNPLTLSSMLAATVQQPLPLVALGVVYSFTVPVPGAQVGQAVLLNVPVGLWASLSAYAATVTAAGIVTVQLKAGAAIAAGTQTFYLRVLR
jgi:hypothetical protein